MSDEPEKRLRAWICWGPLAVCVLYPLSFFPVDLGLQWTVSRPARNAVVETLYAPLIPVVSRSPRLVRLIERASRSLDALRPRHR
jgi:hypothetical protein